MAQYHLKKSSKPDPKKKYAIVMKASYGGKTHDVYMGAGFSALISEWSQSKKRLKGEDHFTLKVNQMLEDRLKNVNDYLRLCKMENKKQVTKDELKAVALHGDPEALKEPKNFFIAFDEFRAFKHGEVRPNTYRDYGTAISFYKDFQEYEGEEITFEGIDMNFFNEVQKYAYDVRKYKVSTFGKRIKVLTTFLNWSFDQEFHQNRAHDRFTVKEELVDLVVLTSKELIKLYHFKFKDDENQRLEKVRDKFCFACCVALRISDLRKLDKADIKQDEITENGQVKTFWILDKLNQKTGKRSKFPLSKMAVEIYHKYKDCERVTLFAPMTDPKYNQYIKECAELAEINEIITKKENRGPKNITEIKKPKYDFITSHTARKTFTDILMNLDVKSETVQYMTTHLERKGTFKRYYSLRIKSLLRAVELFDKELGFDGPEVSPGEAPPPSSS